MGGFHCLICKKNMKTSYLSVQRTKQNYSSIVSELEENGLALPTDAWLKARPQICAAHAPKTQQKIAEKKMKCVMPADMIVGEEIVIESEDVGTWPPGDVDVVEIMDAEDAAEEDGDSEMDTPEVESMSSGGPSEKKKRRKIVGIGSLFLVTFEQIDRFVKRCRCGKNRKVDFTCLGATLRAKMRCRHCGRREKWSNGHRFTDHPKEKAQNIDWMVPASMYLSGVPYQRLLDAADAIHLHLPSKKTYSRVLNEVVLEAVDHDGLRIATDGSYDSVGYCAMLCRLPILCLRTQLIISVVQKERYRDGKGNSGALELLATKEAIEKTPKMLGIPIKTLTTDRSSPIKKHLADHHGPGSPQPIIHLLDSWHITKEFNKKLRVGAKLKRNGYLELWRHSVVSFTWGIIFGSDGDSELIEEKLMSILQHVCGIHDFSGNPNFKKFKSCQHGPDIDHRPPLDPNSAAFHFLESLFTRELIAAYQQADYLGSTAAIESFNSALLKHCPKRIWLGPEQHQARLKLAILEWNTRKFLEIEGVRWISAYVEKNWKTDRTRENQWRIDTLYQAREIRYAYLDSKEEIRTPRIDFLTDDAGDFRVSNGIDDLLLDDDAAQLEIDEQESETQ
ncbi:unnamed protein product, partial [Mesorhabditis spiculigera]